MMEPSKYKDKNTMEDNFGGLRVSDQSEANDVSLSGLRVNVRRQDSSMADVFLGLFENEKKYVLTLQWF